MRGNKVFLVTLATTRYAASVRCTESKKRYLDASGHVGASWLHNGPVSASPVPQHASSVTSKPSQKYRKCKIDQPLASLVTRTNAN